MDVSALPYLYCLIVDCVLMLIIGFIQWRQKRVLLWFGLAFLATDSLRCLFVMLSAGEHGVLYREDVVWIIRGLVMLTHTILIGSAVPFALENTTLGRKRKDISNELQS